ncbi:hypothetical protein [Granulicella mallensis]|nr:hypothetical protein [Granulicella mallensis]
MHRRILEVFAIVVCLLGSAVWCQSQIEPLHEQHRFDIEYEKQMGQYNVVPIPSQVYDLLTEDKDVRQAYSSLYLGGWFSPGLMSISNSKGELYLATWEGVFAGVPGNTFWLLKTEKEHNRSSVIFKITADRLVIGQKDASSYPEIIASQQTTTARTDSVFRFVAGTYILSRQYTDPHYREQKSFNADDGTPTVQHPVPIPEDVFKTLSEDDEFVREALNDHGWPINRGPKNGWLTASLVSKPNSKGRLYLVVGNGSLAGAHGTTFWLVTNEGDGIKPRVIFKIATDQLEIGKTDISGYPVITAVRETAVSMTDLVFHFVAGKYVFLRSKKDH